MGLLATFSLLMLEIKIIDKLQPPFQKSWDTV